VYSLLWSADSLNILVDDQPYFTLNSNAITPADPFNNKFFLIFNIAVGGGWPGAPNSTTQFPQRMVVDYVRVFQK
jgi:beta-glucanase (GH16 family)